MEQAVLQAGVAFYLGTIIYLANLEAATGRQHPLLRPMLYSVTLLVLLYGLLLLTAPLPDLPPLDPTAAGAGVAVAVIGSFTGILFIRSDRSRAALRRLLGERAGYDPASPVHTTAIVLMLAFVAITLVDFVASGGIGGMATTIEETQTRGIDSLIIVQTILFALAALLGVGVAIRRDFRQALARLGLRVPTPQDLNWGIGVGLLAYLGVIALTIVWMLLVTPEQFAEQTAASEQIARSFDSIPVALVLSLVIAFGEEIFFRGAIQPIFGLWFTSIFFVALHTQYALTPATVAILLASLAFGWLRQRYSTTAAIAAHFVYNFVQLALAILVGSSLTP